jgi:hypothetical protein
MLGGLVMLMIFAGCVFAFAGVSQREREREREGGTVKERAQRVRDTVG